MRRAQARREAVYGEPGHAIAMAFGDWAAGNIVMEAIRCEPDPRQRKRIYRQIVCDKIVPGGQLTL